MTHSFSLRVYYEDTDAGGVVYHANYLKFIERARSEWVRGLGIDQKAMRAEGQVFVVSRIEADYLRPALYDDALSVETRLSGTGGARARLEQVVLRSGEPLFRASVVIACMTLAGKPVRLPAVLRRSAPAKGA